MTSKMSLREHINSAWEAFVEVGGSEDMFTALAFDSPSQAYYAGQVWAYARVLYEFGTPLPVGIDFDDLDRVDAEYV